MCSIFLTILQVFVVTLHYLLAYSYSFVIITMETIGLKIGSIPAGQWIMSNLDYMLQLIGEAAMWSKKGDERSASWIVFLPILVGVHWTRLVLSVCLYTLFGMTVSRSDISKAVAPIREYLQDMLTRGQVILEEKQDAMSKADLDEFFLYRLTKVCVCQPVSQFSRNSLHFFGLLPAIKSTSTDEVNEDQYHKNEHQDNKEENNDHHHHHEHHHY